MAFVETILFVLLVIPISCFMVTIFVLAALGKSLGFRKKYVEFLLWIFEYGHQRIENAQHKREDDDDSGQESGEEDANSNLSKNLIIDDKKNIGNDIMSFGNHISAAPENDTAAAIRHRTNSFRTRYPSGTDEPADYEFSDIFEFVQSGIEAIVNDQVTQRFVAEELKSWNLLTRTNRHYEFISWRLSLVWVAGFFLRYCIMLPLRITICFLGTFTLMVLTFVIGLVPDNWGKIKQMLNNQASKFSFRLLSRAFSAIVTYHQVENKPRKNGLCVANHTSPIDVVVLACDSSFAMVLCLTLSTFLVGLIPFGYSKFRRDVYNFVCLHTFGLLSWAISAVITHHELENRPGGWIVTPNGRLKKVQDGAGSGGICVANHTSPIDVLMLAVDNTYDMIGQSHGGFLGVLQRALARASSHIWFERSEIKDRSAVARRLKAHVEDTTKLPVLIFPEGTCINNSAVMQFKKGSFEVGGIIYPVAIKYDPRFGDPFWNSSEFSMLQYLYMMMTSWAIVCDVWYLPPMTRNPGESSVDFANRVKKEIAQKGGLVDLDWDGQLKRAPAKREWKEKQQLEYSKKFSISPRHIVSKSDATSDSPNPST